MALVSFTLIPPNGDNDGKKQEETTSTVMSDNDEETESSASHCPCSKFTCSHGHRLELSYKAYKEYTGRRCSACNGKGYNANGKECSLCDGEGREWEWRSGCVCKRCGEVYALSDDC